MPVLIKALAYFILTLGTVNADELPSFDNRILTIPVVNTPDQLGKYEQVQFQLADDGRWDLLTYSQPQRAPVDIISIESLESFPVHVKGNVSGYLPNGCYEIGQTYVSREDNQFIVAINMSIPDPELACTQALVPYDLTVPLDVYGLTAGIYLVDVNSVTGSFKLDHDNF